MTWNQENLQPAKLADVAFAVSARSISGGRRKGRYQYPYRNGQHVEDMGREPYKFRLTIPLYRGMGATLADQDAIYPGTLDRIVDIVQDDGTKAEVDYVDPAYGVFKVAIGPLEWQEDAERQDGGVLTLELEEIGTEQDLLQNVNSGALSARARALKAARNVDRYVQDLIDDPDTTLYVEATKPGFSLEALWDDFQGLLDAGAMALDDVASRIDSVTSLVTRVANFSAGDELSRWSLTNSCVSFVGAAKDVAASEASTTPGERLVEWVVPAPVTALEIAQQRYGDASRADEISANNPLAGLTYQPGEVLYLVER